ncbi:MAG: putative glutathione S-transferase [Myxococcota bacterium]|jgi:putative glutathione S-transferase
MGLLVDGIWSDRWYDTKKTDGRFVRAKASFRRSISSEPGSLFPPEAGRYHLYVSLACPWAHRTLIVRRLKGLTDHIGVVVVAPLMGDDGWVFDADNPDTLGGRQRYYELYRTADATFSGRVTVPALWDEKTATIVSNESSEIIRMLNSEFPDAVGPDFYPEALRADIDAVNERVYHDVNNGVYKAGFATTQPAYDEAVNALFATLDWLESRMNGRRFLVGDTLTEADIRLFTTLIRFDPVYVGHFKCDHKRIVDYPNLWAHTRRLFQTPGVSETVNFEHIRGHYYESHRNINPFGIRSTGPELDYLEPA